MGKKRDLTGKQFGRLTVLGLDHVKGTHRYWKCICSCGNETIARTDNLNSGGTKSCGCYQHELAVKNLEKYGKETRFKPTHGDSNERLYSIYLGMVHRCTLPTHHRYKYYGARGIKVLWNSYEEFRADMKESYIQHCKDYGEKDTTIERVDPNGHYCKENCIWETNKGQANNRRNTIHVEMPNGELISITLLAEKLGEPVSKLRSRYYRSKYNGTYRIPYNELMKEDDIDG